MQMQKVKDGRRKARGVKRKIRLFFLTPLDQGDIGAASRMAIHSSCADFHVENVQCSGRAEQPNDLHFLKEVLLGG
jgi:hypothetical protein